MKPLFTVAILLPLAVTTACKKDDARAGAADAKAGAMGSLYLFATDPRLNHATEVVAGLRADECAELLRAFFAARR